MEACLAYILLVLRHKAEIHVYGIRVGTLHYMHPHLVVNLGKQILIAVFVASLYRVLGIFLLGNSHAGNGLCLLVLVYNHKV